MLKRIFIILLSVCLMACTALSFAESREDWEDWDDWDDWGDEDFGDEELEDDESESPNFLEASGFPEAQGSVQKTPDGYEYFISEDETYAVLCGYVGGETNLLLPDKVDDIPVLAVNTTMCAYRSDIETVEIPGSVLIIGTRAFTMCENLRTVVINEGVKTLGPGSFSGLPELTEIVLPDSLEVIDDAVMANCPKLEEITFGSSLQYIGWRAFMYCSSLSRVKIPGGEEVRISEEAFSECADDLKIVTE